MKVQIHMGYGSCKLCNSVKSLKYFCKHRESGKFILTFNKPFFNIQISKLSKWHLKLTFKSHVTGFGEARHGTSPLTKQNKKSNIGISHTLTA